MPGFFLTHVSYFCFCSILQIKKNGIEGLQEDRWKDGQSFPLYIYVCVCYVQATKILTLFKKLK